MNTSVTVWLGIVFVLTGAVNVWLILAASARGGAAKSRGRWIAAHRIGGYLFISLFCVMGYFMVARLGDIPGGAPAGIMVHLTLAMILGPLLFVKVLVARYYTTYHSILLPVGLAIFVVSFVLIGTTVGPRLAHQARAQTSVSREEARALVDQRCGRCHNLDRVYKTAETPQEWRTTVARMVTYAAGSAGAFQPAEVEQIIAYLSLTQTPDAVHRRQALAASGPSAGRSPIAQKLLAALEQAAPRDAYDRKTVGFLSLAGLGLLTLVVRRPSRVAARPAAPSPGGPLVLKLASIAVQARDAKTLRFIVPGDRTLHARPGQFLTFSFLFDGRKVVRSYSICSSPARSGYVEITAKRVNQGCASAFLNDRAAVGMTVEAAGPSGRFCFDENRHPNVVLLAAGSGITPIMAMLRYMDDFCLDTNATLLYCVRTSHDILFAGELQQLQSSLKNFQYHVLLSQPDAAWSGPRGHISREFLEDRVEDFESRHFFLCGPPAFMDAARAILTNLGVKPERVLQESFGGPAPKSPPENPLEQPDVEVEFVRSGKRCLIRPGQTVLEAAGEQGVAIPSSCRQGLCGTCKTRLLEGEVQMDAEDGLDAASKAQGFVLTCVGHARGAVKLDA